MAIEQQRGSSFQDASHVAPDAVRAAASAFFRTDYMHGLRCENF